MKALPTILGFISILCPVAVHAQDASGGPRIVAIEHKTGEIGYYSPLPPYPYAMRNANLSGEGRFRVSYDHLGAVLGAVVIKSTGSGVLDGSCTRWIKAHWKSVPGNASTLEVSVIYSLNHSYVPLSHSAKVKIDVK